MTFQEDQFASDRAEMVQLKKVLMLIEFSPSIKPSTALWARKRLLAAVSALDEVITLIERYPIGATRANLLAPLARWRATRAQIHQEIAGLRGKDAPR